MKTKIIASGVFVTAILIFLAGIYWGPESEMYSLIIAFCIIFLLGCSYDLIARCYNYVLFDEKEIINRRFLRKNIVVKTKDVKQYRVREIDNAEVVELLTATNRKVKSSMKKVMVVIGITAVIISLKSRYKIIRNNLKILYLRFWNKSFIKSII